MGWGRGREERSAKLDFIAGSSLSSGWGSRVAWTWTPRGGGWVKVGGPCWRRNGPPRQDGQGEERRGQGPACRCSSEVSGLAWLLEMLIMDEANVGVISSLLVFCLAVFYLITWHRPTTKDTTVSQS